MATDRSRDVLDDDDAFDGDDEDTLKDMYLTFRLDKEEYGIETRHVTEIIAMERITEVPDVPPFVKGVINLRGHVIPVIDMRLRFLLPAGAYGDRTCIVIVRVRDTQVGLVVDTVREVLHIPQDHVSPPPRLGGGARGRWIQGIGRVGEAVKILLDVEQLLYEQPVAPIEQTAADPAAPAGVAAGREGQR